MQVLSLIKSASRYTTPIVCNCLNMYNTHWAKRLAKVFYRSITMKVKLKDIAQVSGVSVSTVSRVINGDRERPASAETADKIWSAVRQLGYVPNQSAKNLVKGEDEGTESRGQIGCVFTSTYDLNNDPFFSCIGLGIQRELSQQAYTMAFSLSTAMMDYKDVYGYLLKHPCDGIIVLGQIEKEMLELLKRHTDKLVYAGINPVDGGFDQVICDGYRGTEAVIRHLIEDGHSNIGYVGFIPAKATSGEPVNEQRYQAYCDVMKSNGHPVDDTKVVHTGLKTTRAYEAMSEYLGRVQRATLPSAFFCANDAVAFGVMRSLRENGLKVPEDVSVIGMDNVEMASFVSPALSTVNIPRRSMGSRAVKMLIEQIEDGRDYPMRVDLPFELKVRESSIKKCERKGEQNYAYE